MSNNYEFSVILLVHNSELFLNNAVDSIINQNLDFKENIQLIMVVNDSIDDSLALAMEYQNKYPDNIIVLQNPKPDFASSKNLALSYIEGKYVNFFEANDYYSSNLLKSVKDHFEKFSETDVVSAPSSVFSDKAVDDPELKERGFFDLNKNFKLSSIHMYSSFIRKSALKDISFPEHLLYGEDVFVMDKVFINNPKLVIIDNALFNYRKRVRKPIDYIDKTYCDDKFDNFFNPLIDEAVERYGEVPKFLQYSFLGEVYIFRFVEHLSEIYDSEEDIALFWDNLYRVISCLEIDVIKEHEDVPRFFKSFLIYLKNDDFHVEVDYDNDEVYLLSNDFRINNLRYNILNFDIVELTKDSLNLTGSLTSCCMPEYLSVIAIKQNDGKKTIFEGKYSDYPTTARKTKTILGIDWEFSYHFDFKIPVKDNESFSLDFQVIYHENEDEMHLNNSIALREFAGLSSLSNYFVKHSKIVLFRGRTFYCMPYSYMSMWKYEIKTLVRILRSHEDFFLKAMLYRLAYIIMFPFMKNRVIWLFVDREEVADDNAEHLFKYAVNQDDGIKKYFLMDKSSPEFKRLKKINKNIVPFGSVKHKLLYLFSQKIMSSQLTRRIINPFVFNNSYLYEGVSTYDFCFLQHGVILHDLSSWIRKYNKNLYLFVTSAEGERDSIVNGDYNYDPDRVQVLGLSRYDNLYDDSKKEILFIPTWRRNLNSKEAIINSDYLLSMNSFLNNEKLINAAKEKGYQLVFRPHPDLWKFVDLFKINENFRISEESYQELFRHSSVMITDYSSVAFDFAYLKKPLIYYHRESFGEFHYDKGYFNYDTMGFGSVVGNEEDLVDKIIEYMDNNCEMEDEYKSRVDKFFKFNDKNNCKRIYDWLMSH